MTDFRISVTSDIACPWCYVGRRNLQRAQQLWLGMHPDSGDTFSVTYSPFQLNPGWPKGPASSMDKQKFYNHRFGAERAKMMHQHVSQMGRQVGINFRFGGRTGSTRDAHRLVHLAKKYGSEVELKTVDGLFAAYFEEEKDVTAYDTLRDVAAAAGIPAQEFQKAIVDSDQGGSEVDKAAARAILDGVSGVPYFTIQDGLRIDGARQPDEFLRAFEAVKAAGRRDL